MEKVMDNNKAFYKDGFLAMASPAVGIALQLHRHQSPYFVNYWFIRW